MKRVVAISGSPRKDANTETIIKQIIKGTNTDNYKIYRIEDLNINGCKSCYACRGTNECILKDDMQEILEDIKQADLLIIGTPIFMWQMTGQTKIFTDRLFPLMNNDFSNIFGEKEKDSITVFTQAAEDASYYLPYIDNTIKLYKMFGFKNKGRIIATEAMSPTDAGNNSKIMELALNLGKENS